MKLTKQEKFFYDNRTYGHLRERGNMNITLDEVLVGLTTGVLGMLILLVLGAL